MDAAIRKVPAPGAVVASAARAAPILGVGAGIVLVTISMPGGLRALLAFGLILNIVLVGLRWPRAASFAALVFLPVMALVRRLLISEAGWATFDPLLLVGPAAAAFLVYRTLIWPRKRLPTDLIYRLVLAMLVIAVVYAFNPLNPSPEAGVTGLLFVAVPLLWFLVGREIADSALVRALILTLVPLAAMIGVYGWVQSVGDVPSWDDEWLRIAGYSALSVGDKLRAFGTLSSSLEYAQFLGIAGVSVLAFALHGRLHLVPLLPFLAFPLWLSGVRGGVLYALIAVIVVIALRTRRPSFAAAGALLGIAVLIGGVIVARPALVSAADSTGNPLIIRQVEGLTDPFNEDKSSAGDHWRLVKEGFTGSLTNPVGQGTGSVNISAQKFGGEGAETGSEVDISNAFIGFGVIGGFVFLAIVIATLRSTFRRYFLTGDPLVLAVAGMLIVTLGQWLNGGLYAVASITWFLIGWVTCPQEEPDEVERGEAQEEEAAERSASVPVGAA
jgi:hypothetical protein